jgi:orotate phosphoribosyltransferase
LLASPKDLNSIIQTATYKIRRIKASVRINKLASTELKGVLILPSIACQLTLLYVVVKKQKRGTV